MSRTARVVARAAFLPSLCVALSLSLALSLACRSKPGVLVVGIQSEPMGGAVSSLHVVIKVDGVVADDEVIKADERSPLGFPRPWEKRLSAGSNRDAVVDVQVDAFDAVELETPLLTRLASTRFVPGREKLLRVGLESRCIVYPTPPREPGSPPGPLTGPTCDAPQTCIRGACQSDVALPGRLETYVPSWASHPPDMCKLQDGGAPSVLIGTGQTEFSALTRGQVLRAEPGPQGGHHIWIAVRMQNMSQNGSTTKIFGLQAETGVPIPPSTFAFPFDPGQEGTCELYGLRYQLDNGGIDYKQFLGKPLDVTVAVVDGAGATATSSAHIQVAAEIAPDPVKPAAAARRRDRDRDR